MKGINKSSNNPDVWWQHYRRRQRRPNIRNWSKEDICRRVFSKTVKEYVANCSLAGVKHMRKDNISVPHRVLWITIFCVMLAGVFYFMKYLWFDNLATPLIVKTESITYPITEIDFPAVVICSFNRISRKALQKFVRDNYSELAKHNESIEEVEAFFSQLGRLIDFTHDWDLEQSHFLTPFAKLIGNTRNIDRLMRKLAPSCEELLVKCMWGGNVYECNSLFTVQKTVHGHCCTFNYILTFDYTGKPKTSNSTIKRQSKSGRLGGLRVLLDHKFDDTGYTLSHINGFEIFLFDATHFGDPGLGRAVYGFLQPNELVNYKLNSVTQLADSEVRKYSSRTRNCLFHNERPQEFNNMYSFSACITACRVRTMWTLCQCTPYFLPYLEGAKICSLDDLKCLNKYKEKFQQLYPENAEHTIGLEPELQDSIYCPECLPDCEIVQHSSSIVRKPMTRSGTNMTGRSLLVIYNPSDFGVLNRLDLMLPWYKLFSNVGGFCGVLVGFSIISLFEVFYFIFIRSSINLYQLYQQI